jgi:hypothetical protein
MCGLLQTDISLDDLSAPSSIDNIDFTCRVREIHVEFNSQRSAARKDFGMLLCTRCFKLSLTIFQVRSAPDT